VNDASESPKGYRFPKLVISHAVYLYHRLPISYRDVQELLFKWGIDVSHETVRAWCVKFGPDLAEALDVLLQRTRCKEAAKRCLQRLLDEQDIPEQIVTDGLRSYGAAIRETPELSSTLHVRVSAAERQNNLIEQSHRPTRDKERQQRGFRSLKRTQRFLFTHAEVGHLFRHTRARTPAFLRRRNWLRGFSLWDELALSIP
jgi:putative transposase